MNRPLLRYHGGKWRLAPWIISHFPAHTSYVEPFGGGGSVLLRKERSKVETYNDIDGDVVNVFRVMRDRPQELVAALTLTPYSRAEFDLSYLPSECPVERARRMIARSYFSFGTSSRRKNRTGFRATAQRAHGRPEQMIWREFPACCAMFADRMRGVCIEQRDALEVIEQQDSPRTLFYVDPPYPLSTRGKYYGNDSCYVRNLSDMDHELLASALQRIEGLAIVSTYPSPLYDRIFSGWLRKEKASPCMRAGLVKTEVLYLSPRTVEALNG